MKNRSSLSRVLIALAVLAACLLATPASAQEQKWFHVRVSEGGADAVEVSVNLPLTLIESALKMIPAEVHAEMQMELREGEIELAELRRMWQELRSQDDATFVTVESKDETIHVAKEGDFLIARTLERTSAGTEVNVKLPFAVVDALFAGDEHEIDLAGAIRALAEHGSGDMVTVTDGETRVRIWVDDRNESEV